MNRDPARLLEDPEAWPELRGDLQACANDGRYDVARGLVKLEAAIAVGTPPGGNGSAPPAAGGAGGGLLSSGAVVAGGAGAAIVAAVVGAWAAFGPAPVRVVTPRPAAETAARETSPSDEPRAPAPLEVPAPASASAPAAQARTAEPDVGTARPAGGRAARGAAGGSLQVEVEEVAQARALLTHDPRGALALVEAGNRRFAAGMLSEEREAIAILALFRMGRRDAAVVRAERFMARHPRGPFREQIRSVLEGTGGG